MQAEPEKQGKSKQCTKCGETKPLTEFYRQKQGKLGVRADCKACRNAVQAKYRAENPEYHAKYHAKYRAENREERKAYNAKYFRANPDKVRAYSQRRRARKRNASGDFTDADWKARLAYHGYKCIYCGVEKDDTPQGWLTCEHLIPLSRGGTNWPSNLAPSCMSCNCSKGTKTHFEYLEFLNEQKEV